MKADTDRVASVVAAFDVALEDIAAERVGLVNRIKEIVAQSEEAATWNARLKNISVRELARAEERLIELARGIALFSSLRESLRSQYPKKRRPDRG